MSNEPKLAYTVHHNGRQYTAGMTASEIGPDAGGIGAHAWEGGVAPEGGGEEQGDGEQQGGGERGGTPVGQPPVPTVSALPTAPPNPDTGDEAPAGETRRGGRRGGNA